MKKLRTIFMGTPDFSVPCLEKLIEISDVIAVITQPDKRQGRGNKILFSPVKNTAIKHNLTVYQPQNIRTDFDFINLVETLNPDLIIVVAFGQILPKSVLSIPKFGCINVHASLLPFYRGAAPIQWALINGEKTTGLTTMLMDSGLDTGDILKSVNISIDDDMNLDTLHDTLMNLAPNLLENTISELLENRIDIRKQDDSLSSYAPMIEKQTGKINWKESAKNIHNLVRGLDSWPGAYCSQNGKIFKIWRTKVSAVSGSPGEILGETISGIIVGTGENSVEILEIQAPGKKRMKTIDYIRGNKFIIHSFFDLE